MARKLSYALFGVAIALVVVLHLGNALLAGLLSYVIMDWTNRKLSRRVNASLSRGISIAAFVVVTVVVSWLFWFFLKLTLTRVPAIVGSAIPRIAELASD